MQIKTDGLIIRDLNVGESDRIVTILTRKYGVLRASARGARKIKNSLSTATQLLCHSDFTLFRGREKYIIDEAQPLRYFWGVRNDIEKLALAQYFAELCGFLAPQEEEAELYLRLALNSLHLIEKSLKANRMVKAVFEMRLLTLSGYMPDLLACGGCGVYEDNTMYLIPESGGIACSHCALSIPNRYPLSIGCLAALRHIVYADFERLFSFSLNEAALDQLVNACEGYLLYRLERSFKTLEFYKSLGCL